MRHLEQLMLTVGLVDKVTRPIQGINQQIQQTGELGRQSMDRMVGGAAGLAASGVALYQALMPAIEMDRVLGEVKSLSVVQQDLDQLTQTATAFSIEFGKSATEFVGAAYDIKSAMGDLSGDELAGITKSSAVLAAATKADTATITAYMGTMYGTFKKQADAMGKDNFAAMVAGQTAQAVESFKTTGAEMSAAFTSIGATGTAAGASMAEQMAVLGTLQATMSGSEAGTKYKSFLNGIAGAQDKLNMSFVDGNGNALGMVEILQKLKDQFGDTLTVAESDALKKAFGSDEAVALIKQMLPDIDGLAASIDNVGQQTGMDKATDMAGAMTDQWERLGAVWFALRAGAGASVLPTINGIVGSIVDAMAVLVEWTDMFPNLTEMLTWVAIGIGGLTAVMSVWSVIAGIAGLAMGAVSWPILAVVAAIAALIWLWEPLSAFLGGFIGTLTPAISQVFEPFGDILGAIGNAIVWLIELFGLAGESLDSMGAGFVTMQGLGKAAGTLVGSVFKLLLSPLWAAGKVVQWVLDKLSLIPGINIDTNSEHNTNGVINTTLANARQSATAAQAQTASPILPQIARVAAQNGGRTNQYGDVYITAGNGMSPEQLAEWEELQHGF
ncbi:MAG: phage tail tape measure protein [Oceanospirillales bacterium]|nr:phage tail tape measure protein [Oceanospirillales bacterium]